MVREDGWSQAEAAPAPISENEEAARRAVCRGPSCREIWFGMVWVSAKETIMVEQVQFPANHHAYEQLLLYIK